MPTRLEMIDGQTSPPNLLTEADLISLMDKHGIGIYILSLIYLYTSIFYLIDNL